MDKVKVGSLFSGIGGIDLGFEQAGFEIAWANDFDAAACKTYRNNFPSTILIEDDVRNINPCALSDIDVLVAGFPCQPFSVMGYRRGFNDPRGNLFFEIHVLLMLSDRKWFFWRMLKILWNMTTGKHFWLFTTLLHNLVIP